MFRDTQKMHELAQQNLRGFNELPAEILFIIFSQLDLRSLGTLMLSAKGFYYSLISQAADFIWQAKIVHHFPDEPEQPSVRSNSKKSYQVFNHFKKQIEACSMKKFALLKILKQAKAVPIDLRAIFKDLLEDPNLDAAVSQIDLKTIYDVLEYHKAVGETHELYPVLIQLETQTGFLVHEFSKISDWDVMREKYPQLLMEVQFAIDFSSQALDFYQINTKDGILFKKIMDEIKVFKTFHLYMRPQTFFTPQIVGGYQRILQKVIKEHLDFVESSILKVMQDNQIDDKKTDDVILYLKNQLEKNPKSYVLKKLLLQAEIVKEMQLIYPGKPQFPFSEVWRFVIDGAKESQGAYVFEDEVGYIVGALNGLLHALRTLQAIKDKAWYIQLHDICVDQVYQKESLMHHIAKPEPEVQWVDCIHLMHQQLKPFNKNVRDLNDVGLRYSFVLLDQDEAGIDDLFSEKREGWCVVDNYLNLNQLIAKSKKDIYERLDLLFNQYNQLLSKSEDQAERLISHLWLCRELEIHHVFLDANGRSSLFAAINLAIADQLPPMLFDDPNVFDANSPKRLCEHAINAMQRYLTYCNSSERLAQLKTSIEEKFQDENSWDEITKRILSNESTLTKNSFFKNDLDDSEAPEKQSKNLLKKD